MSEQTESTPQQAPEAAAPQAPKQPNPIVKLLKEKPVARHALAYAILVGLIAFSWARAGWVGDGAARAALIVGADGIAAAFTPSAYVSDSSRIEKALRDIVQQGGFRSATFTDMDGNVLASTDLSRKGTRMAEFSRAKVKAEWIGTPTGPVIRRQIYMAEGNPRGVLEIALQN